MVFGSVGHLHNKCCDGFDFLLICAAPVCRAESSNHIMAHRGNVRMHGRRQLRLGVVIDDIEAVETLKANISEQKTKID